MTQRHRRRVDLLSCAAVVALASTLISCGSDGKDAAESPQPAPAGGLFDGTYSMFRTTATVDRETPTGTDAQPASATWIVRSSCSTTGSACVAVARSTTPDTTSGPDPDQMDFVYGNGSWSRVAVPPARPCIPQGTTTPVDEPWVAIDSTTLTPRGGPAGGAVATLAGPTSSIQGGSCSRVTEGRITLTRTGDLPADVAPVSDVDVADVADAPRGAGFRGVYQQRTTVASWNPPTLISNPTVQTTQIAATPTCTRDGKQCVVVLLDQPSQPGQTVVAYDDGGFTQTETLAERPCPGRAERYRPTLRSRTTIGSDSPDPIPSMQSESTLTWSGPCAGSVTFRTTLTRTGD